MENTRQLVERINALFVEGNMESFMDYLAEDVIWEMFTSSSGHTVLHGKKEVSEMDGSDMPEHTGFEFGTIVVDGETASVQGKSTGKLKDGTDYHGHFCDVYHFRNNKIAKIESYVIDSRKP
ncbi:nuclear transport factor 2 family protein [Sphingobacterium sp. SGR-19]|uniref:nuclear transport factor 2 family protein n=1 Tax=Sphingobacterium sp. SGR-19 TaxID=2710886 RepID=UPI0013EBAE61|nr:nuclear transport factor 2 family protein [Sphingobacterium sp. SGR-19]NGM65143.1 nuclear transport factor 2 family protein [Sphingobacterium sp. SGR-19]